MVEQLFSFSPFSSAYSPRLLFDSSELDLFDNSSRLGVSQDNTAPQQAVTDAPLQDDSAHIMNSPFVLTPGFLSQFSGVQGIGISKATQVPTLTNLQDSDMNRAWRYKCQPGVSESDMSLVWKTRCQEFIKSVPHRMYSSLKYEFKLSFQSNMEMPFLLARISILEDSIQKEAHEPLSGTVECAMSREKNTYKGLLKVQISQKLTYYHTKSSYCFEVRILDPQNLDKDILSMKSPSFKIYARKPQESDRKRKPEGNGVQQVEKKKKEEVKKEDLNEINEFTACLDQLLSITSKLNDHDKNTAKNMVIHRFFSCEGSQFLI